MSKTIKVGSKVKVVDSGRNYSTYNEWADRNSFKGFVNHARLEEGDVGTVEVIAPHTKHRDDILLGINIDGKKIIINITGVEIVSLQLEDFQRVLLRNGQYGVVVTGTQVSNKGKKVIVLNVGWCEAFLTGEGKNKVENLYEIVEIFNPPDLTYQVLDITKRGDSIWKEISKDVEAADKAIEEAQNAVEAAEVALAAAKTAREALK